MVGEVHLQGRDGDMALRRDIKIGVMRFVFGSPCTANQLHGFATRALLGDDLLRGMPATQATQLVCAYFYCGQVRDIHIHQPRRFIQ